MARVRMTIGPIACSSLLLVLSFVIGGGAEEETVHGCHVYLPFEIEPPWGEVFTKAKGKKNCTAKYCAFMWAHTLDNRIRILAQGCSSFTERLPQICPEGIPIGTHSPLVLTGRGSTRVMDTVSHFYMCLCEKSWCNASPMRDGEWCEGSYKDNPLCKGMGDDDDDEPEPDNYAVLLTRKHEAEKQATARFCTIALLATVATSAIIFLSVMAYRKLMCVNREESHDEDEIVMQPRNRHVSGTLNSITQVTILTEVAQGYKQEAEAIVLESHAGGPHQIANWKYDESVKLGTGSFGAVYKINMRTEYLMDVRVAALKTFNHRRSTHFFNEIRTLKYIQDYKKHPNIIQYLGRAVECRETLEEATWRIAFELCAGGTVREWITATPISLLQYLEAANGLLSALSFLHTEELIVSLACLSNFRGSSTDSSNTDSRSTSRSRRSSSQKPGGGGTAAPTRKKLRIAHCDVNSRNILVRNRITGNVVLADFGLALTDREKRQEDVQMREIGTIRYLAPEMLQCLINLNDTLNSLILVDTYAAGLVLWEILSRTREMYEPDAEVPAYTPPYEKELSEIGEATVNRFEAMRNVVVRRGLRPAWSCKVEEWKKAEEEAATRDADSSLSSKEKFLMLSANGISSMMARDPDARMSISSMAEKVMMMRMVKKREERERAESVPSDSVSSNYIGE